MGLEEGLRPNCEAIRMNSRVWDCVWISLAQSACGSVVMLAAGEVRLVSCWCAALGTEVVAPAPMPVPRTQTEGSKTEPVAIYLILIIGYLTAKKTHHACTQTPD